jgi:hypothetical protein
MEKIGEENRDNKGKFKSADYGKWKMENGKESKDKKAVG